MAPHKILVKAGPRARKDTPACVSLPNGLGAGRLVRDDTGQPVRCQVLDGSLHFVVDGLPAGAEQILAFDPKAMSSRSRGVEMRYDPVAATMQVKLGNRPFTTYCFGPSCARPHFYPFLGPGGTQMTRQYPMCKDVVDETRDHVHHRGIWVALGDVNGTDNWTENEGHAWQTHRQLTDLTQGPVLGQFTHTLDWEDHHHVKVLHEVRTIRFYRLSNSVRVVDLTVALVATEGDVKIGDTKEGGVCSVRVPTEMDANKGGRIENSFGGLGEQETWGKPAHWCDYSGLVGGQHLGVAIFDHPFNLRHPTPWHVRNYGLMTANPFGHSDFRSGLLTDGSYTIGSGMELTFRYRVMVHRGDARRARIADRYNDYIHPPTVEWLH